MFRYLGGKGEFRDFVDEYTSTVSYREAECPFIASTTQRGTNWILGQGVLSFKKD